MSDSELNAKLWEGINALALMGIYLEHTDHLRDRELCILLLDDILLEEMVFQSGEMNLFDCDCQLPKPNPEEKFDVH